MRIHLEVRECCGSEESLHTLHSFLQAMQETGLEGHNFLNIAKQLGDFS